MNKKGETNNQFLSIILSLMIILIALSFIQSVANTKEEQVSKTSVVNETLDISSARNESGTTHALNYSVDLTITNNPTGWKTTKCPLGSFTLSNASGYVMTDATDYDIDESTGVVNFYNTLIANMTGNSNTTYASYNYCEDGYLTSSGDRGLAKLWTTLMIMALLIVVVGIGYTIMNKK